MRGHLLHLLLHLLLLHHLHHRNVLVALKNATSLKLYFIKEFCLKFIIKEVTYNQIVMSKEFETLDQTLMVEIIRRRQVLLLLPSSSSSSSPAPTRCIHVWLTEVVS